MYKKTYYSPDVYSKSNVTREYIFIRRCTHYMMKDLILRTLIIINTNKTQPLIK